MSKSGLRRGIVTGLVLFAAAIQSFAGVAKAKEWKLSTIKMPGVADKIYFTEDTSNLFKLRIVTRDGKVHLVKRCGVKFCIGLASKRYVAPKVPSGALPDAEVTTGSRNISAAWLADPTRRYGHAILGDAIEAGAAIALDERRKQLKLELGSDSVFEDRKLRLADMDGDGKDELLVVRSYLDRGAALAMIKQSGHGIEISAETPPLGVPNRWLNPAAIADFDGDGKLEVAIVVTPHIGGILEFWELKEGKFVREMQLRGFSNHAIGSRVQDMSAVADFDGDRIPDLALPADGQRMVRIISFAKGAVAEVGRIKLPGRIVSEIRVVKLRGASGPVLVTALDTGELAMIQSR